MSASEGTSAWVLPRADSVCHDGRTVAERVALLKECAAETFKAGNLSLSAQMYTEVLRLAPSHAVYSNRSAVFCANRQYIEAFQDSCQCIDLMPAWPKVCPCKPTPAASSSFAHTPTQSPCLEQLTRWLCSDLHRATAARARRCMGWAGGVKPLKRTMRA